MQLGGARKDERRHPAAYLNLRTYYEVNMSKEKTSRFVSEVIRRYGDRYDYLKTDYHDCKLKVIITCRVHGDFMQSPSNHLAGNGCPICAESSRAKSRRSGTDEFVRKAKSKHGDKYIYDEVDYKSTHSNVTIICKTHGAFNQTPCNHLSGNGCPKCAFIRRNDIRRSDSETFISKAKEIHSDIRLLILIKSCYGT